MRTIRILLMMTLCISAQEPKKVDWTKREVNAFYEHFGRYYRALFGCPAGQGWYDPKRECDHSKGTLDSKEYRLARQEAMRLFDLKEKEKK